MWGGCRERWKRREDKSERSGMKRGKANERLERTKEKMKTKSKKKKPRKEAGERQKQTRAEM